MLINILSIFLSTSVITTLVNTYDENNKSRTLANIAYSVTTFIIDDYTTSGEISFNDYLNKSVYPIKPMLDSLDGNVENLVIFIADGAGNVKLIGGSSHSDTFAGPDGIVSPARRWLIPFPSPRRWRIPKASRGTIRWTDFLTRSILPIFSRS